MNRGQRPYFLRGIGALSPPFVPYLFVPRFRKILMKINRLKVSEFRQKSTKGRKCEILFMPGV
jgi:hypothetical protein